MVFYGTVLNPHRRPCCDLLPLFGRGHQLLGVASLAVRSTVRTAARAVYLGPFFSAPRREGDYLMVGCF